MKSRTISELQEIEKVIHACNVCNVSMITPEGNPYVIPMNFGFENDVIYLHSSYFGKKIEALRNNPSVCISFSTAHELKWQSEKVACSYSMRYKSVLAYGQVQFLELKEDKIAALNVIMKNYTDKEFSYNDPSLKEVCVFRIKVEKLDGRVYGY